MAAGALNDGIKQLVRQYEKVLTLLAVALLLGSLVYLAVRIGSIRQLQANFDRDLSSYTPKFESVDEVEPDLFVVTTNAMMRPNGIALSSWTNVHFTIPETRVTCTDSKCLRPVPYNAEECPYCLSVQTKPPVETNEVVLDADKDGMLDEWERRYGLSPFDASDAAEDLDGDGHSNLTEFKDDKDPTDPEIHPRVVHMLRVEGIEGEKFGMLYKSRARTPKGPQYGLNYLDERGQVATAFASMGDVVDGFVLTNHVEKFKLKPGTGLKVDVSELTLVKGDRTIVLTRGQPYGELELTAHFVLTFDGSKYAAKEGEVVTLDGLLYRVIDIDRQGRRAVIRADVEGADPINVPPLRADR